MVNRPVRVTTRVLPDGEVIVVVEPIIAALWPQPAESVDRNTVIHLGSRTEGAPDRSGAPIPPLA